MSVLLVAPDGDVNGVKVLLVGTGAFTTIDTFAANSGTPTVAQLQTYRAVLVWSNAAFANATALGNNLADYWDSGGSVVTAMFALSSGYSPPINVGGRWLSGGYNLMALAAPKLPNSQGALNITEPDSPLVIGVASLTASQAYQSGTGALANGGVVVAKWGNNYGPLIVRGDRLGRQLVVLNMYPAVNYWQGNGANIIRNALLYSG
jgi:hypothetical protein